MADDALIRFAGYQLDPAARTLRYEGQPIALGPKTFDLLVFLAQHPHKVVTKDELLEAVWPNSFVEESNLSQHVFLLRKALSNTGQAEQIVTTVPGKGYQFTATVEQAPRQLEEQRQGGLLIRAVQSVTRVVVEEDSEDEGPELRALPAPRKRSGWLIGAAAGTVLLVAAGGFAGWRWLHPMRAGHIDIVLSELENSTGDTDFDRVLNQALTIDLEQSPFLSLPSRSRIKETLAEMQKANDEPLTPAVAREICERNNAQAMLHGSISKLGSRYVVLLAADGCVSGKQIAGYKAEAASKEEVLGALDAAAGHVRSQLGESEASLERFQTPIMQATTTSLDALRAYTQAGERFEHGDMKGSQSLLEHAIALDANFASAYRSLSATYYNRGDFGQASKYIQKAFELRERATERERLGIETAYYAYGNYDYEATIRTMQLLNQIYPNNARNLSNLCNMYTQLGEYKEAIAAGEESYRIDPHLAVGATILARAYKRANRFDDAKRVANPTVAEGKDGWGLHSILLQIAYAEHDAAKIKSEGEWGLTHQGSNEALDDLAFAAATGGKLREAVNDFARARAESLRGSDAEFANSVLVDQAAVQIRFEEFTAARETLSQLRGDLSGPSADAGNQPSLARLKACLGDIGPAQHLVATAGNSEDMKNTVLQAWELPQLRALLALKARKPAEAVQLLEPARPYQLRDFEVPYLRAEAEVEAGMLDAGAADYRLILDNQGVDPISPTYSLSHLRLARVLVLQKKTEEARNEYRAFLEAWKDADPDLKLLMDAKHELAQLR